MNLIKESAHGMMCEYYDNDGPESASEDFYNSDCVSALNNRYPDMDFEFSVSDNGTVTALDMKTGKYYVGYGEVEYETVGTGYPSHNDYDSEGEDNIAYYDYYNCLKTIMQKIDNDEPDGINEEYVESQLPLS